MSSPLKIITSAYKNVMPIAVALLFFSAVYYAQDKPKANSHSDHKQSEACDHSKMDQAKNNKADSKMSCSTKESASKSCCSSESAAIKEARTETVKPWNAVCPIMGEEIDPEVKTVEYKGKTIGFCCPKCIDKFNKDPEGYLKKISKDGKKVIES